MASTPGQGSTFTVYLPLDGRTTPPAAPPSTPRPRTGRADAASRPADELAAEPTQRPTGRRAPSTGVKILVVDDDFRNIFAMTALLERGHADVTVAESGAEAHRHPRADARHRHRPDGHHDAGHGRLRDDPRHPRDRPVQDAARSSPSPARSTAGERERCIDAGANDYVPKPVDTAELLAALRPWLPTDGRSARSPLGRRRRRGGPTATSSIAGRGTGLEDSAIDGVKILVVDDDFRNIFALTALLERGHADVTVAESGAEAIATLERTPDIDIVLMDIMMPVMDGYDTIRAIRTIDRFKTLPIIAVTGKVDGRRAPALPRRRRQRLRAQAGRHRRAPRRPRAVAADRGAAGGMTPPPAARRSRSRRRTGGDAARRARSSSSTTTPAKRLALKAVLAPLGYSIVEADSGLAALRCVMAQDFAVILLDVRMPIMDGFETAALIRQRRQSEMTPIIFITAYGSDEIVDTDLLRRRRGRLHLRPGPAGRAPGQGLGLREPLHQGGGARRAGAGGAGVRRPAAAPHRRRPDRHLPDRRREQVRVHQPALDRDHRHPGRRGGRAGLGHDHRLERARRPDRRAAGRRDVHRTELAIASRSRSRASAPRIVLVTSKSIPDGDGGIAGWVGTLADVTAAAREREAELGAARRRGTVPAHRRDDDGGHLAARRREPHDVRQRGDGADARDDRRRDAGTVDPRVCCDDEELGAREGGPRPPARRASASSTR